MVANFYGADDYVRLDTHLAQMLSNTDTGLRRSLTSAVLAGPQEAARFGIMMVTSAGGQLPAGPALDFARNQLGRFSYAFGAFVNPPVGGVDGRTTSHSEAIVDDIRRMDDVVVQNSQLPVANVGETAWRLGPTDTRLPDTAVLDQRVAQPGAPLAKQRKTTAQAAGCRAAGKPASRPTLDATCREEAALGSPPESDATNKDAPSIFYSSSVAEARPERDLVMDGGGGESASTVSTVQAVAAGDFWV